MNTNGSTPSTTQHKSQRAVDASSDRRRTAAHAAASTASDHGTTSPSAAAPSRSGRLAGGSPSSRFSACARITCQNSGCAACTHTGQGSASAQNSPAAVSPCHHDPAARPRRTHSAESSGAAKNHSATGPLVIAAAASATAASRAWRSRPLLCHVTL